MYLDWSGSSREKRSRRSREVYFPNIFLRARHADVWVGRGAVEKKDAADDRQAKKVARPLPLCSVHILLTNKMCNVEQTIRLQFQDQMNLKITFYWTDVSGYVQ